MDLQTRISMFKSLSALTEAFQTEEDCRNWLEAVRWDGNPECSKCGNHKVWKINGGELYKCGHCRRNFSIRHNTMFAESRLPLRKWFIAIYLHTSHKKGISSCQLARDIDVKQHTAWFMLQRIRFTLEPEGFEITAENRKDTAQQVAEQAMKAAGQIILSSEDIAAIHELQKEEGRKDQQKRKTYEVDETYVGGKEKNKHASKRVKGTQGRSTKSKAVVLAMMERGGRIVAGPVDDVKRRTLVPVVKRNIQWGSTVISDNLRSYEGLAAYYEHFTVNHAEGEYVRYADPRGVRYADRQEAKYDVTVKAGQKSLGQDNLHGSIHTNTVENFWSQLKRGIIGVYHSISVKHLGGYVAEFCFRYNTRGLSEGERVADMVQASLRLGGCRLTYKQAIGKEKPKAKVVL